MTSNSLTTIDEIISPTSSPSMIAVQQQLERLAKRHPSLLERGRNKLGTRHIKEEGFDVPTTTNIVENVDHLSPPTDSVIEERYAELFQSFARVVCKCDVIPRKELFEAFGMAMYVHNHFFVKDNSNATNGNPASVRKAKKIRRVADLACSHGLLSWALMLLRDLDDQIRREIASAARDTTVDTTQQDMCDDDGGDEKSTTKEDADTVRPCSAVCVDRTMPPSSEKVAIAMQEEWPDLADRWDYVEGKIMQIEPAPSTLLVGVHCCGQLSDQAIDLAIRGNAPLALVPCCHTHKCLTKDQNKDLRDRKRKEKENQGALNLTTSSLTTDHTAGTSSIRFQEANSTLTDFIDMLRIKRLEEAGYDVQQARIPEEFSPKNRIILATPPETPIPEHILSQSTNYVRMKPVVTLFNKEFEIPVADTAEARQYIRSVSGRAAANLRRRRPPPKISLSLLFPEPDFLSLEQIHDFANDIVTRYGPMVVRELAEFDANNPARLPVLFRRRRCEENDHNNNTSENGDAIKFSLQVRHVGIDVQKDDGYAQTYGIDYGIDDDSGTMPQISKTQAKALHLILCRHVLTAFDGKVKLRQQIDTVQLEKDVPALAVILSGL